MFVALVATAGSSQHTANEDETRNNGYKCWICRTQAHWTDEC